VHELTTPDLVGAIKHLYPSTRLTGWGGGQPSEGANGILLSVNSLDMAVTNQKIPAPLQAFDGGNQPDFCWQNAKTDIEEHKSHMFVIEAAAGESSRGVERASAVTVVVDAISYLFQPMGVMWVSAKNLAGNRRGNVRTAVFRIAKRRASLGAIDDCRMPVSRALLCRG
jgi:hypothetical protein